MQTFTIIISVNAKGQTVIEALAPDNVRVEAEPFKWRPSPEVKQTLEQLKEENSRVSPTALKTLGAALYDVIFNREIAVAYSRAQNRAGNKNLRLKLQIEPPSLTALPWEALYHQGDWMATDSSAPLVRCLPDAETPSTLQTLEVTRPLRVLFIGATPLGLADLQVEMQYNQLQHHLQEPIAKKTITLDSLFHPAPDQLRQTLLKDYHIIYFAGHGAPERIETSFDGTKQTRPAAIFINSNIETKNRQEKIVPAPGQAYPLTAEMFAGMLRGRKNTRLVFLAACNTGATSQTSDNNIILSDFARKLARRAKLPAIVAMQYYISNMQAVPLTAHFFASIAQFNPVDVALADARHAITRQEGAGRDVLAPVMYLQAENAALFKKAWNRTALALAVLLAIVLILASASAYILNNRRAAEQTRANAEATQRIIAVVTAESRATGEAIALVTSEARATARAIEAERADAEATQRVFAQETAAAEAVAKATAQYHEGISNLASQSQTILDTSDPTLGMLLALESLSRIPSWETDQSVRKGLSKLPSTLFEFTHNDQIFDIDLSSDGRLLATASADKTVRIWDTITGQQLLTLSYDDWVFAVKFSPDGKSLGIGSSNIIVYNLSSTNEVFRSDDYIAQFIDNSVKKIQFSPDGNLFAAITQSGVKVWEVTNGYKVHQLTHNNCIALEFSPDNKWLATAGYDKSVKIWSATTGTLGTLVYQANYASPILDINFSPNSQLLAVAVADRTARILDIEHKTEVNEFSHELSVQSVSFSPDSSKLATGSNDVTVRIWDIVTGALVTRMIKGHEDGVKSVLFSPNGLFLATASFNNTIEPSEHTARLWNVATGQEIERIIHNHWVSDLIFAPDGRWLATASLDGVAKISLLNNNLQNSKLVFSPDGQEQVISIGYSPDGQMLATKTYGGKIRIWDIPTGRELNVEDSDWVNNIKFSKSIITSPNDQLIVTGTHQLLATGNKNGAVIVKDMATKNDKINILYDEAINSIVLSADGKWLAIATGDGGQLSGSGKAIIWNLETNEEIVRLEHDDPVRAVAFSPDSKQLATVSRNSAQIWYWQPTDLINEGCMRLNRNLTLQEWQTYIGDEPYRPTCPNLPLPESVKP